MSCVAVLDLYIAVPRPSNDLTPVGIVPYNREMVFLVSPVVLRSCGAMIFDQVSFVVVVLT
eukprot:1541106-Pyramimonas_sp.AAC.1